VRLIHPRAQLGDGHRATMRRMQSVEVLSPMMAEHEMGFTHGAQLQWIGDRANQLPDGAVGNRSIVSVAYFINT
jgi:hypothetical protein